MPIVIGMETKRGNPCGTRTHQHHRPKAAPRSLSRLLPPRMRRPRVSSRSTLTWLPAITAGGGNRSSSWPSCARQERLCEAAAVGTAAASATASTVGTARHVGH